MSPDGRRFLVTLGYLVRDEKLLLLERPRPPNAGLWSPPGGKADPGESPEMCLRREFQEETGLVCGRVELAGMLAQYCPGEYDVMMFLFRILEAEGTVVEGDGGPLEWVPLGEVFRRPVPQADHVFGTKVLDPGMRFFRGRFLQDRAGNVLEQTWHDEARR